MTKLFSDVDWFASFVLSWNLLGRKTVMFYLQCVLEFYLISRLSKNTVQERGIDSADLIAFLLELSFHVTGEVLVVL